jgi:hypothetical protein
LDVNGRCKRHSPANKRLMIDTKRINFQHCFFIGGSVTTARRDIQLRVPSGALFSGFLSPNFLYW